MNQFRPTIGKQTFFLQTLKLLKVISIVWNLYLVKVIYGEAINYNDYALSSEKVMAAELTQA